MTPNTTLRIFGFVALAFAGSCSVTPDRDASAMMMDGAANHPIRVEPSYRSLKVDYLPGQGGLTQAGLAQLDQFVVEQPQGREEIRHARQRRWWNQADLRPVAQHVRISDQR